MTPIFDHFCDLKNHNSLKIKVKKLSNGNNQVDLVHIYYKKASIQLWIP